MGKRGEREGKRGERDGEERGEGWGGRERETQTDNVVPMYSVPIEKTSGCNHIKCWKVSGGASPGQLV